MYCSKCGAKNEDGAVFCRECGAPLGAEKNQSGKENLSAVQSTNPSQSITVPKRRGKRLLIVIPAVVVVVVCIGLVILSGRSKKDTYGTGPFAADTQKPQASPSAVSQTEKGNAEGPGFAMPEDAAKAYLTDLRNQDLDAMLSTFAIESYVNHIDFDAALERTKSYSPGSSLLSLPNANDYTRQLNIMRRKEYISSWIMNQYMYFNAPDEFKSYQSTTFSNQQAGSHFVEKFKDDVKDYVFKDLVVTGTVAPKDLSDQYSNEKNQSYLAKLAPTFGVNADDIANVAITFEANGKKWLFCPQTIRYNNKWYLQDLSGDLAEILNLNSYVSGIAPMDAFNVE